MMNRLRAFMAGRNGMDGLGMALLIAAVVANLLSRFVHTERGASALSLIALVLMVWCLYRIFSRNIAARQKENQKFTGIFSRVKSGAADVKYRMDNASEYKFFTCPGCKNRLRVPRGKGKIQITCPKCGQRFGGKS